MVQAMNKLQVTPNFRYSLLALALPFFSHSILSHYPLSASSLSFSGVKLIAWCERNMGRLFLIDLEGTFYCCKHCQTPLVLADNLIYRSPESRYGHVHREVVNITVGERKRCTVHSFDSYGDLVCVGCGSMVGQKFLREVIHKHRYQMYTEGILFLERTKLLGPHGQP